MLIYTGIYFLLSFLLFFIFKKLEVATWKALIPFYNIFIWLQSLQCPWWWLFLVYLPGVNFIMLISLIVLSIRAINQGKDYGKLGGNMFTEGLNFIGHALVFATVVHQYIIQPFVIPTSSMEKSLLVGDYLLVSKLSYGAKIIKTPLSLPFVHNAMPGSATQPSFSTAIELPYFRLKIPFFSENVKRNDVVVFNFPEQDSVLFNNTNVSYYDVLIQSGSAYFEANKDTLNHTPLELMNAGRSAVVFNNQIIDKALALKVIKTKLDMLNWDMALGIAKELNIKRADIEGIEAFNRGWGLGGAIQYIDLHARPVDKMDNYVKRCVAIAGDKLAIKDGQVFINGQVGQNADNYQFNYTLNSDENLSINKDQANNIVERGKLVNDNNITEGFKLDPRGNLYELTLKANEAENLAKTFKATNLKPMFDSAGVLDIRVFPRYYKNAWNKDNFGPMIVPKKGETVQLDMDNIWLYQRIIQNYEHNQLEIQNNKILIDGQVINNYTFKQNYYWMMGDNRHNSLDSRFWGFVPEDHIVGKAVFVGININKQNRDINRWFTFINDKGLSKSYLIPGIIFLMLAFGGGEYLWNKLKVYRERQKTLKNKAD